MEFGPERFAQLIETLPVGVFILDAAGRAIYANAAAESLRGRGLVPGLRAEQLGERYAAYIAGTNIPYPTERMPIVRALAGERTSSDDTEIDRHGERIAIEVTATPIFDDDGSLAYAVAVFQDITERRRAQRMLNELNADLERMVAERTAELARTVEALERASRAKSVFLMNVSHELRTPLNHIIGFSELLVERLTDERNRKLAQTAENSGRDLLTKINDLIELARIEIAPTDRPETTFDFDMLLRELCTQCDGSTPIGDVRGDVEAVRRVISEILACAAEHDEAFVSVRRERATRIVVCIDSDRLAQRVRSVAHLFGEGTHEQPFRQREVDFRIAVARAQARILGGDIVPTTENERDVVHVTLPL